jgi:mannosyltransferase
MRTRAWWTWALLAATLAAWAIRLYRLDVQSLSYDEAVTAQVTQQGLADLTRWTADDIQPPLYYYGIAGWVRLVGASEWALRLPSAAWGVLALPLMAILGRRLYGRRSGLLAAALTAGAPLYIYYSQDARMYTQLTTLGLLSAYSALRASEAPVAARRRWWIVFALSGLAAVYTHYFAFFLLAAFACVVALRFLASRSWQALREFVASLAVIFIAYLPWLPVVLTRYRVDASYWQGQLKLDEALRHVWLSFTLNAPQSLLERDAARLGWGFAAVAALAVLGLCWRGRRAAWPTAYLLGYLALPLLGILILSSRTPKFNPRYLMLASPPFWLLVVGGLSALAAHRPRRVAWGHSLTALALCFLFAAFAWADRSWFLDPRFLKADFRGVAEHIRTHMNADEAVILVSGHMAPAWTYYAPQIPAVRLPPIDVLDVNAVLDYTVGDQLAVALAGKSGAWLVLWQDEVVDPNGVVADLLEQAGTEVRVKRSFWNLRVRRFQWPPGTTFRGAPPIAHAVQVELGGRLRLLGYSQLPNDELHVYWQALTSLTEDLKVVGELVDAAGHVWGRLTDRRLADYEFPTFRWRPGQVVLGRYGLPADGGAPPGEYQLRLRVYVDGGPTLDVLDAAGAPQGQAIFLAPVRVSALVPATDIPAALIRLDRTLPPGLSLLDVGELPASALPGDALTLEVWWRADRSLPPDLGLQAWWQQGDARVELGSTPLTGDVPWPTQAWPTGAIVRGQRSVRAPRAGVAGEWALYGQIVAADGRSLSEPMRLGATRLLAVERVFTAPPSRWPAEAVYDGRIRLLGVDAPPRLQPGASLTVTVTWQAVQTIDESYTAFIHLIGPDGRLVAQEDRLPANGARPTTSWLPGEVIADRLELALPDELAAGRYTLEVGWYDANRPGLPRLRLADGADAVRLGELIR